MSETTNIAEIANKISSDLFKWFKWKKVPLMDEDFDCVKFNKHCPKDSKGKPKKTSHNHPVDVVYSYFDPYKNRGILLNTDLKSYISTSISKGKIEAALESLAKTIDCAKASKSWQDKYRLDQGAWEVRGLLFIYNHDSEYDKEFTNVLKKINTKKLPIEKNQQLHVLGPGNIVYLNNVVTDFKGLIVDEGIPQNDYTFFYPELYLHKHSGDYNNYPATIELLTSPYLILQHGSPSKTGENPTGEPGGYIIYYNRPGDTDLEFMYLLDSLSRFQMLSTEKTIKLRIASDNPNKNVMSNFRRAVEKYVSEWGGDDFKKRDLDRIDVGIINTVHKKYIPGIVGWRE